MNVFHILILFTIALLLFYFSNHILDFIFGLCVPVFSLFHFYQLVGACPTPPPTWAADTFPLSHLITIEVKLLRIRLKKISTFITFCEVLLSDVKVEVLLFSWHFFMFLCMCHLPAHLFTTLFFGKQKVLRWYISGPSFIYFWLAVPKFSKLKCFHSSRKLDFRLPTPYVGGKHHPFPPLFRHHLSQIVKWNLKNPDLHSSF